jgi:DNA-binding beta-propeller fold protein YncE/mono/diheme cytochrome c family protein
MKRTFGTRHQIPAVLISALVASSFVACSGEELELPPGPGVTVAERTPPAISGGTLIVTRDAQTAIAADPDRDRVWIADLAQRRVVGEVVLEENDEPGRVVEGSNGRAYVALRRGGAVVAFDTATAQIASRTQVCPAPRGLAHDAATDLVHVACAGGELVTLDSAGQEVRRLRPGLDLRDIVIQGDDLLVTQFRSAKVLVVGADGAVREAGAPAQLTDEFEFGQEFAPAVAWRTIPMPNGGAAMVHQRALTKDVTVEPGGYGGTGCVNGIVHGTVTIFRPGSEPTTPVIPPAATSALPGAILPVDMAVSADGNQVVVVAAGSNLIFQTDASVVESGFPDPCGSSFFGEPVEEGQPVAVAFREAAGASADVVVQLREPAALLLVRTGQRIDLPGVSVADTGHDMFHTNPGGGTSLACASCHPEGREDGRTWNFNVIGARRTQSIGGGILATAPLHWDGDMADLDQIMSDVFVGRMAGQSQGPRRVRAIAKYIDSLPVLPVSPVEDTAAAERGRLLFTDATVGCAGCHNGAMLTNNKSVDVGTGRAFQVPTLVGIASRAPFMHDGCAPTLRDRFGECGGGDQHGRTSHLTEAQIDDLVVYLETL